ncbi:MAG: hypothetical protein A3G76_02185 [Acidobacteria bacterium RIFCSPLOWO2_12_FULL_65_11]|nr:MAG: hypothetical protein A3G76_02185 [Acidobacteria bacterium RIFCSPLOWO2_12_FULL_65_11]
MKRDTRRSRVSKAGSASRAEERDLSRSDTSLGLAFGPLDLSSLRKRQTPRTGVGAILGRLPDEESDDGVIEALDRLS